MKWYTHLSIAWAVAAPFGGAPGALLGATAPDWLESLGNFRHREETHALALWALITGAGLLLFLSPLPDFLGFHLFWFGLGGVLHWLGDALTASGVPLTPWSKYRVTLLGGRLRTGQPAEYLIGLGFLLLSFFFLGWKTPWFTPSARWHCLLTRADWCEASRQMTTIGGEEIPLASPYEVRRHRFEW